MTNTTKNTKSKIDELETTPQWLTKPCLIWVGKCLGADLYADVLASQIDWGVMKEMYEKELMLI